MYDAGIILVSDPSTAFTNTLLYNAYIFNNWLESCCIIIGVRCRTKIMISLNLIGKCSWISNHFYIMIESMNIYLCIDRLFPAVVKERDKIYNLGHN